MLNTKLKFWFKVKKATCAFPMIIYVNYVRGLTYATYVNLCEKCHLCIFSEKKERKICFQKILDTIEFPMKRQKATCARS